MAPGTSFVRPAASSSCNDPLTALLPIHLAYSIRLHMPTIQVFSILIITSGPKKKQVILLPACYSNEQWNRSRLPSPTQMSSSAGRPLTADSVSSTLPLQRFNSHATGCFRTPSIIHPSYLSCPRTKKQSSGSLSKLAGSTLTTSSAIIAQLNSYAWHVANYTNNVAMSLNFGLQDISPPEMPLPTAGRV